jgi:4-amino-4-deoxy-L-arabinose transferase-like glycosyltransferase
MVQESSTKKISSLWQRRQQWIIARSALTALLAIGTFLRFYHLGQAGVNEYYAAAVKSMLLSWHNFFFVAFEPGGTISVDKPPLGLWIEALSAYLFGFNGFALTLPNAFAGVLSIFLIYKLVRRPFGQWAGLAAAAVLAVMPVAIATERSNTSDGMLVLVLLLAAWAFLQSVYSGKARWLFLGVLIVGLGFNFKMLQAFLPLPAFYALYLFGTKGQWLRKAIYLSAATALLLAVSFSWAMAVDLTPAADRPYVDSSRNNSVMELIFGWNGLTRLMSPLSITFFGLPGPLRLFKWPLVGEASWLLPFILGGLIMLAIELWKRPFGELHASFILWAGWLLIAVIFFSYSQGLMHNYHLIMIGGPIATLTAMTLWALWQIMQRQRFLGWALTILLVGGTLAFETHALRSNTTLDLLVIDIAGILFGLGIAIAVTSGWRPRFSSAALGIMLAAMMVVPVVWSGLTTFNNYPPYLPSAGPGAGNARPGGGINDAWHVPIIPGLLNYLLNNTQPGTYLFATGNARTAASYILATDRPVLALGGFHDYCDEVQLNKFISLVKSGQLRFAQLSGAFYWHQAIAQWVMQNCTLVNASAYRDANGSAINNFDEFMSNSELYQCGC